MEQLARIGFFGLGLFAFGAGTVARALPSPAREATATAARDAGAPLGALPVPAAPPGPLSPPLKNPLLRSPLPGGRFSGYAGDTGLDIGGDHLPVHAVGAGTVDYAERGHTRWTRGRDTPFSVRIALDAPIAWGNRRVTHVWYTHLAELAFEQAEGTPRAEHRHVEAGERLGVSGIGNGVPHLHLGLLLDGRVDQDDWTYILREHEVRKVLGDYANGTSLAPITQQAAPVAR